jgi:hypothetical protein
MNFVLFDLSQVEEDDLELTYTGPVQSIALPRQQFWTQVIRKIN